MALGDIDLDQIIADPLGYFGYGPAAQQQQQQTDLANRQAISRPMTQEDQDALLQRMLGTGASALSYAGSVLNKTFGGRAARAGLSLLTGGQADPTELLSMIPGSDTFGLTDEKNQVTGRHLLDQWGVTGPAGEDESFWSPANLAGIATDVATDPATYLTFGAGAATKAGQTAEKLGVLPKTTLGRIRGYKAPEDIAAALGFKTVPEAEAFARTSGMDLNDILNKPLGGLFGTRVPFTSAADTGAIFGTGDTAAKVAETIGKPFTWLANTKPAAYLAAQFNPVYEGVTDPRVQNELLAKAPYYARRMEGLRRGVAEAYDPIRQLGEIPQDHNSLLRSALEGQPLATGDVATGQAYTAAAQRANALKAEYADLFREAGGNLPEWESVFGTRHAYRTPTPLDETSPVWTGTARESKGRQNYAGVGPARERQAMFDLPGGTGTVESLVRNPEIGTSARTVTPGGIDLSWLQADPRRAAVVEGKLSNAMNLLTPADQQEYMALGDRMAGGPLAAADQARYDALRQQYLASRNRLRGVVREDVLGGYNPRELATLRKADSVAQAGVGPPLTPQEADRMAQLESIDKANRYAMGKMGRLYGGRVPVPGEYADAADQFLPRIKGVMQDQAAADVLRKQLGVDSGRLAELVDKAGITPDQVRDLVDAEPAGRRQMLLELTSPGPNGTGNMLSEAGGVLHPDEARELLQQGHLERQVQPLAHYLGRLDPQRLQKGLFNNDPLADLYSYGRQLARGTGKADIVNELLAAHAIPTGPADTGAYGSTARMPVGSILNELQLDTDQSAKLVAQGMKTRGVLGTLTPQAGDVAKAGVPQAVADSLMQLAPRGDLPEYAAGLLRPIDAATQLTRASITAPWPGFHVRNLTTDEVNILQKMGPGGVGWGPTALAMARGEAPAELLDLPMVRAAGITDPAEAARLVGKEAFATGAFGPGVGRLTSDVLSPDNGILRGIPGAVPQPSFADVMTGKTLPANATWTNPLAIQGLLGQTETRFAPAAWGRGVAEQEDTLARGGAFLHQLSQGYAPSAAAQSVGQTVYGGANFTPFEQNVMRRLMPFWGYCVPDSTLALTRYGWRDCDQIEAGDELLTFNVQTKKLEWQKCEAVSVFTHDAPLLSFGNRRHKIRCTHRHTWIVNRHTRTNQWAACRAEDFQTNDRIVVAAPLDNCASLLTPRQAALVGWLVTDGHYRKRKETQAGEGVIYQSPKKFLAEVMGVAGGKPSKPHPQTGVISVRVTPKRLRRVEPYLTPQGLLHLVTRLSPRACAAMYRAMYRADGVVGKRTSDSFCAQKRHVAEAFMILATLLGKRVTRRSNRRCVVSQSRRLNFNPAFARDEWFTGRVWCPTTPNGTWIMRQGQFIGITGNTKYVVPQQAQFLAEHPGGLAGQGIRAAAAARGTGFLPEYLSNGLAVPLGQEDDGTRRFLSKLDMPWESLFQYAQPGPNANAAVANTGMNLLSNLNPLIKGPLEGAVNKQFLTGRDLDQLYGGLTGVAALDNLIYNSPISRAVTTARTLVDPRKYQDLGAAAALPINLLTGAKVSDVDMEKQRGVAELQALREYLSHDPNAQEHLDFTPKGGRPLSPEEVQVFQLLKALNAQNQKAAAQRRAAGG